MAPCFLLAFYPLRQNSLFLERAEPVMCAGQNLGVSVRTVACLAKMGVVVYNSIGPGFVVEVRAGVDSLCCPELMARCNLLVTRVSHRGMHSWPMVRINGEIRALFVVKRMSRRVGRHYKQEQNQQQPQYGDSHKMHGLSPV